MPGHPSVVRVRVVWLAGLLWSPLAAPDVLADAPLTSALTETASPRLRGLGGSGVSIGGDPTMAWLNPAAAARLQGSALAFAGQRGILGDMAGQVLWAHAGESRTGLLAASYGSAGMATLNALDGSSRAVALQEDLLVALGFAAAPASDLTVGALVKMLHSVLFEEFATTQFACDLGMQYRAHPLAKIGLALRNAGTRARYLDDAVAAPLSIAGGAVAGFRSAQGNAALVTADAEYQVSAKRTYLRIGAELILRNVVTTRVGATVGGPSGLGGLSFGLGFQLARYRIEYGLRLAGDFEVPQSIGVMLPLGGPVATSDGR